MSFIETGRSRPSRERDPAACGRSRPQPAQPQRAADGRRLCAEPCRAALRRPGAGARPRDRPAHPRCPHAVPGAGGRSALESGGEQSRGDRLLAGCRRNCWSRRSMCCGSASTPTASPAQIANLAEWKRHFIERLHHQVEASGDQRSSELAEELTAYPAPASSAPRTGGVGDRRAADARHCARPADRSCRPRRCSVPRSR